MDWFLYGNQWIYGKTMDWFLYGIGLRHEWVNANLQRLPYQKLSNGNYKLNLYTNTNRRFLYGKIGIFFQKHV